MTFEDAASAVVGWLAGQPIKIEPEVFGREIEPEHFRIGIAQVSPEPRRRIFDVHPLDMADCYEVKEMEYA